MLRHLTNGRPLTVLRLGLVQGLQHPPPTNSNRLPSFRGILLLPQGAPVVQFTGSQFSLHRLLGFVSPLNI